MNEREFVFWLKGFLDSHLGKVNPFGLELYEVHEIVGNLNSVFDVTIVTDADKNVDKAIKAAAPIEKSEPSLDPET